LIRFTVKGTEPAMTTNPTITPTHQRSAEMGAATKNRTSALTCRIVCLIERFHSGWIEVPSRAHVVDVVLDVVALVVVVPDEPVVDVAGNVVVVVVDVDVVVVAAAAASATPFEYAAARVATSMMPVCGTRARPEGS
jgi:hypothetical protein